MNRPAPGEPVAEAAEEEWAEGEEFVQQTIGKARHCAQCPFTGDPTNLTGITKYRAILHFTLEIPDYSMVAKFISLSIMFLICVSTLSFAMETVEELQDWELWTVLELLVVIVFSAEYLLRLIASRRPLRFVFTPMNFIDLLAVAPFYVEKTQDSDGAGVNAFQVFRVIRLARVFRIFKLSRYSTYMRIMTLALKQSSDAFGLLLFFIGIAVIISSSLMYYAERDVPRLNGSPSPFSSIPNTFYWSVVTMTTTGYGDQVPVSTSGKLIAAGTMLCGILIFALPISILGSNFQDVYAVHKKLKVAQKSTSDSALKLRDHVEAIRKHRVELEKVLKQLRFLLQSRSEDTDFFQVWTTVDYVIVNGLLRIEQFLSNVELIAEKQSIASTRKLHNRISAQMEKMSQTKKADLVKFSKMLASKKKQNVEEHEVSPAVSLGESPGASPRGEKRGVRPAAQVAAAGNEGPDASADNIPGAVPSSTPNLSSILRKQ